MNEYEGVGQRGAAALTRLVGAVREVAPAADDAVKVDQLRLLEELKAAAAAVQATITTEFAASQRESRTGSADHVDRSTAAQIALALRTSPFRARRYLGWARILTSELPATFGQLQVGRTTEWRAMIVARETAWLSREDRAIVDAELAPRLEQLGDKRVEAEAKKVAYRLDPVGYVARCRKAESERRVTLRPAPETMARLSALLPVRQGVASHAALARDADALIAAGDPRSRGQLMADLLVERLTGQSRADDVAVEVELVIGVDALLGTDERNHQHGENESAHLDGYGPIPAPLARDWLLDPRRAAPTWLRRLFARPDTGELVAAESRRRYFTPAQRRFLRARDQICRTPWCEAPIRHADHVVPAEEDGPTSLRNGQGLCAACNHTKQEPGWHARPGPHSTITVTTPTGHRYHSRAPAPPGVPPPRSRIEAWLATLLERAA